MADGSKARTSATARVIAAITAIAAVVLVVFAVMHLGGPTPLGPQTSPTTEPSLQATTAPSTGSGTTAPLTAVSPQTSMPSASAAPADRQAINVTVNGTVLGTAALISVLHPKSVAGKDAGASFHWLVVEVHYQAVDELPYAQSDWAIVDAKGVATAPADVQQYPALGTGTLAPGATWIGDVTFRAPLHRTLSLFFLGGDGLRQVRLVQVAAP